MDRVNKIFRNVCKIFVGAVFIFSGYVKGIDPLGSAYKFSEYFTVAGLPSMDHFSLFLSFLLSTAEFLLGVGLLLGLIMRFTSWVALLFMTFFTLLTFVLAIFNPVTDCGCFGDAVKLTNWQTFFKNLMLIVLVIYIFLNRKKYQNQNSLLVQWSVAGMTAVFFIGLSFYCYRYLPVIDFMPYSVGTNISEKMKVPVGAPRDVYETRLFYMKHNKIKEFTMNNYPWQDSTWKWVETKTVLTKKGFTPPIHDFSISQGNMDLTNSVLSDTGYSFLFVSYNLKEADQNSFTTAEQIEKYCNTTGKYKFYALTASPASEVEELNKRENLQISFYTTDETALKTAIRSNPGIILLKEGIIIGKYSHNDFKKTKLDGSNMLSQLVGEDRKQLENYRTFAILSSLALIITFFFIIAGKLRKQ